MANKIAVRGIKLPFAPRTPHPAASRPQLSVDGFSKYMRAWGFSNLQANGVFICKNNSYLCYEQMAIVPNN